MQKLTACEQEIMFVIWKRDGDIAESQIRADLHERFGKDYARTTIATFLKKMENKGYLEKYHVGRNSFVRPLVASDICIREELTRMLQEYYDGDKAGFAADFKTYIMNE